jgi:hypothetical protein
MTNTRKSTQYVYLEKFNNVKLKALAKFKTQDEHFEKIDKKLKRYELLFIVSIVLSMLTMAALGAISLLSIK